MSQFPALECMYVLLLDPSCTVQAGIEWGEESRVMRVRWFGVVGPSCGVALTSACGWHMTPRTKARFDSGELAENLFTPTHCALVSARDFVYIPWQPGAMPT